MPPRPKTTHQAAKPGPVPSAGRQLTLNLGGALRDRLKDSPRPAKPPHVIIIARAGTGKTTTGIEGMKYLRGEPTSITPSPQQKAIWDQMKLSEGSKSVAMVAFNKSIAVELNERAPEGIRAMTIHQMGLSAIRRSRIPLRPTDAIDGWKTRNILRDVMREELGFDTKAKPHPMFASAVSKVVGLAKVNLVGPKLGRVVTQNDVHAICSRYDIEIMDLGKLTEASNHVLARCLDYERYPYIDYNDMIWWPVVKDIRPWKYDALFVDEAQDLNRCQQELVFKSGNRLIFCGDDRQAIYGFAGADSESINRLRTRLEATPEGCMVLPLSVTRRCSRAVVKAANEFVKDFEAHESNAEGRVVRMCYTGKSLQGEELPPDTELIHKNGEIKPVDFRGFVRRGDMIISRVNAPLISEAIGFLRQKQKAVIIGREFGGSIISLIKKLGEGKTIVELIELVQKNRDLEVEKENARRSPSESKLIAIQDKTDCILEFAAEADTVDGMIKLVEEVFSDTGEGIRLASIHRSKGLEAKRVFFLQGKKAPIPHPMVRQQWGKDQEQNLLYVGTTRAINELVIVVEAPKQ